MAKLEITTKGGSTVTVDVNTWSYDGIALKWTTPAGRRRRLVTVDLDEVVCIVEVT